MAIRLTDVPHQHQTGGLWFEIPEDLQAVVVPWLRSKMGEVSTTAHRQHYRKTWTRQGLREKYSHSIWWKSSIGQSTGVIYHANGRWRVGDRGVSGIFVQAVEQDILSALRQFADQQPEWIKLDQDHQTQVDQTAN